MSVKEYTQEDLVKRAMRNAFPRVCGDAPRWVAVMDTFGLGATYAVELCNIHRLDPEEKVSGAKCLACNP
jgi:hypothetical protein